MNLIKSVHTIAGIVYCSSYPHSRIIKEIDNRLARGADALILGTFPSLSLGFIDPRDFTCDCPLSVAFAISNKMLNKVGKIDPILRNVTAVDLMQRVEAVGGKVVFAGDILLPLDEENIPDIHDQFFDCILLDAKYAEQNFWKSALQQIHLAFTGNSEFRMLSRRKLLYKMLPFLSRALFLRFFGQDHGKYYKPASFRLMQLRGNVTLPNTTIEHPLVSIIVRTCQRPEILQGALSSLRMQAYKNFECIVVEDGEPCSKDMVESEFADLNICYYATGIRQGRAAAANIGFRLSKGEYINMLDDDDYLYPEHILAGITEATSNNLDIVFFRSVALKIRRFPNIPNKFHLAEAQCTSFTKIDPFKMTERCIVANNAVLFNRRLYKQLGGMREELQAHEDWSLWLRYMTIARWAVIPFATSCFTTPSDIRERNQRLAKYALSDGLQFQDQTLVYPTTAEQLSTYRRDFILNHFYKLEQNRLEKKLILAAIHYKTEENDYTFAEKMEEDIKRGNIMNYSANDLIAFQRGLIVWLKKMSPEEQKKQINLIVNRVLV